MIGVPSGASSLHGHWTLPTSSSVREGDAGERRRGRGDLVHDLRSVVVRHRVAHRGRDLAGDLPLLLAGLAAAITGRTRLIRRSALVNVPSFSRNDVPGRNTCANLAVSLRNRSCTTSRSSADERRLDVLGVRVGLGDVLALDEQRRGRCRRSRRRTCWGCAGPARARSVVPHSVLEDRRAPRRRTRAGSRAARAGTSPCRTSPARCSARAAGSRRRRRGRCCRSPSRGWPCP